MTAQPPPAYRHTQTGPWLFVLYVFALPTLALACCLAAPLIQAAAPPRPSDPLPRGAVARLGHARVVGDHNLIAVSLDGKWAFSGKWFDLITGKQIEAPVHVPDKATVYRFFSDGSYLVSGNEGYEIYSPRSKVPRCTRAPYDGFDGTGRLALQTTEAEKKNQPGEVALLDLRHPDPQASGRVIANPKDEPINGQLSADGSRAVWIEYDHKQERIARVCVYDLKASKLKHVDYAGSSFPSVALSPDGKTLALYDGKSAFLFDSATGKRKRTVNDVPGHSHLGCDFTPDGKEVVVSMDDLMLVVPVDSKQPTRQFPVRKGTILADSRRMVTTVGHCVIRIYDLKTGKQLDDFSRFPPFNRVRFISRHVAASWTHDGLIVTWDARTGRVLSEATLKPKAKHTPLYHLRFSHDGRHVAAWSETGLCVLAETATGKILKEVTNPEWKPIRAFFHPSRSEVAVEDPERKRYRWVDVKTGKWTQTLPALVGQPIEISPDARTLLVNNNGVVSLCELATGKPRWRDVFDPKKYDNAFNASNELFKAALVRQGRGVVVVRQQHVTAFDALTGRKTAAFAFNDRQQGHTCTVSADGRWLALVRETRSWPPDPRVRLYDLAAEDPSKPVFNELLPCPRPHPAALALDADGSRLISAHYDGTCFVWDLKKLVPAAAKRTFAELWENLGHADPAEAKPAIAALAMDSAGTVKLFSSKLTAAVEVPPARIATWVKDLDSEDLDRRAAAERGLESARDQAEEALRAAVQKPLSLEQLRRAERLLKKLDPATDPNLLRQARAVEILEYAGTKEVLALLEKLAKGAPAARLTREAKESLARLKRSEER